MKIEIDDERKLLEQILERMDVMNERIATMLQLVVEQDKPTMIIEPDKHKAKEIAELEREDVADPDFNRVNVSYTPQDERKYELKEKLDTDTATFEERQELLNLTSPTKMKEWQNQQEQWKSLESMLLNTIPPREQKPDTATLNDREKRELEWQRYTDSKNEKDPDFNRINTGDSKQFNKKTLGEKP